MDNKGIISGLKGWGANTEDALARMLGNEEMYVSLLKKYKDSFRLEELCALIADEKTKEAFELAHMLKGAIGNLSLTPMYNIVVDIVEPLRNGKCEGTLPKAKKLIELKAQLDEIVK